MICKNTVPKVGFSICLILSLFACSQEGDLGIFDGHGDIGNVVLSGGVSYDTATDSYHVTGGGENMWFDTDAFHYVWKEVSGDVSIAADIEFVGTGGNAHRKAAVLIRQNLDNDAAYADAVVHGDGLTSIQYRENEGDLTHEIQSNVSGPSRLQLEKEGDYVFMSVGNAGGALHPAGGSFRIKFSDPFYVGLAVCAHDSTRLEEAIFSNVKIDLEAADVTQVGQQQEVDEEAPELQIESTLEVISIASTDRRVVHVARTHFEAPNWTNDGSSLIYNSGGLLYQIPVEGGDPVQINTDFATRCNNDHGISPDGTQLVISDGSNEDRQSRIYTLPIEGGTPTLITPSGPSYWHGWSPDGRTLAFVGRRNDDYDIYTVPVGGGPETRLTEAPGLDDGPDYSPDGEYIYFNSVRTGTMQIWRMKADGSEEEQITFDEYNDWFPHPSPDGQWIVFVSYLPDVEGHPANQDVMLRMMPAEGGEIQVLAKLFGGQGTINVPSWSPDSQRFAFVSYRQVDGE